MTERTQAQEFLVVEVGSQHFGFSTAVVASAVAPGDVTPLPFVPDYIEGLVNVNDRVLALLNLATLFAMPATSDIVRTELLVLETGRVPCAVRVDRIVAKVDVDDADLESVSQGEQAHQQLDNIAHARFNYLDHTVLVLNPALIGELVSSREPDAGERGILGRHQQEDAQTAALSTCLAFTVANEHYAFSLQQVVEILDATVTTPVPGAGSEIEGLARVRDDVLLVISLAAVLGLPEEGAGHRQILVLELDGLRYGLRVQSVTGTLSYEEDSLRNIDDEEAQVSGVLMQAGQLIGLLSPERLITPARQQRWSGLMPRRRDALTRQEELTRDVLEVRMGDDVYGVPLSLVRMISELTEYDAINPDQHALVTGAAHIKGQVLPVVDYGRLLNCSNHAIEVNGRGAWIVIGEGDEEWAVPVAEARQIRIIPESAIEAVDDSRGRFVSAIANVNQQLLPLLSVRPLTAAR